jgi:glucose-1-phosphate thymidylyltransferase
MMLSIRPLALEADQHDPATDPRGYEAFIDAATFVQTLEERQGMKIACPEEIAYRMGFITRAQLIALAHDLAKSGYGEYLVRMVDG